MLSHNFVRAPVNDQHLNTAAESPWAATVRALRDAANRIERGDVEDGFELAKLVVSPEFDRNRPDV